MVSNLKKQSLNKLWTRLCFCFLFVLFFLILYPRTVRAETVVQQSVTYVYDIPYTGENASHDILFTLRDALNGTPFTRSDGVKVYPARNIVLVQDIHFNGDSIEIKDVMGDVNRTLNGQGHQIANYSGGHDGWKDGASHPIFRIERPGMNVTMANVTINGNYRGSTCDCIAVRNRDMRSGISLNLNNVEICQSSGQGLFVDPDAKGIGVTVYIQNSNIHDNCRDYTYSAGITVYGFLNVSGSNIYNNSGNGVVICPSPRIMTGWSSSFIMNDSKSYNNGGAGVYVLNATSYYQNSGLAYSKAAVKNSELYGNGMGGIHIDKVTDAYMENNKIHDNTVAGIYIDMGSTACVKGGDIYDNNGYGIGTSSPLVLDGVTIERSKQYANLLMGCNGTDGVTIKGGTRIIDSKADGILSRGGYIKLQNGTIENNAQNGINLEVGTIEMTGGTIRNNKNHGIWIAVNSSAEKPNFDGNYISGGDIYGNSKNNVFINNRASVLRIKGGNIYNSINGSSVVSNGHVDIVGGTITKNNNTNGHAVINYGELTMSGGTINASNVYGIENESNIGVGYITLTGGNINDNATMIFHNGADGDKGCQIYSGANGGREISVYLNGQNKYITTGNDTHNFYVATNSNTRGKCLVHTNNTNLGKTEYNKTKYDNVSINGSKVDHYEKRQVNNNVVVWDRWQLHTIRMEYDIAPTVNNTNGIWNDIGNDVYTNVWGGDKYTVPFGDTPTGFTQYATSVVNPRATMPTEGARVTDYEIGASSARTFYACFFPQKYTITYYGNGSTGGNIYTQTKYYNVPCTILENRFTKDGYEFKGWRTSENGDIAYQPGDTYDSNSDMNLYVYWSPQIFVVTFDTNRPANPLSCHEPACGELTRNIKYKEKYGSTASRDASGNIIVTDKDLPIPTLEGYNFVGWYTEKTGGTKVENETIYTAITDTTLYAHWSDTAAPNSVMIKSATENWVNHDVLVSAEAKDSGSGIHVLSIINTLRNGMMTSVDNISATKTFVEATERATTLHTETNEGVRKFHATATDNAGNVTESTIDAYTRIDKTAPVVHRVSLNFDKRSGTKGLKIINANDNGNGFTDDNVSKINRIWVEVHPGTDPNSAEYTSYDIVNNSDGQEGNKSYDFKFSDMNAGGIYNIYPNEEKITIVVKATDVAGNISTVRDNANYDGNSSDPNSPWIYENTIDNCYLYAWIDRTIGNNGDEASGTPNSFRQGEMGKLHIYVSGNMQHVKIDFPAEFEEGLLTQQTLNIPYNTDGTANLNYSDDIANRVLSKEFDITPMLREALGYNKLYKGSTNEYVPYDGSNGYGFNVAHGGDEGYDFYVPMDMDKNTQYPFTNGQHFNVTVTATKGSIVKTAAPELIVNDNIQFHIQTRIRDPKSPINDEIFQKDVAEGNRLF